ncbi:MAG TPA: NlpC/P60 family protein [Terriglobales bacterium]|nr:NlpC/P60 family protein [Terriglobales bacterium]
MGVPQLSAAQSNRLDEDAARAGAAAALLAVGTQVRNTALDCSHFVNSLFEQVGLYYKYEPSRVLYHGTSAFRRVYRPLAGDLIVWPGHVGIVVDPEEQTFMSALRRGVRISPYTSRYWRRKGSARFFRYRLPISDSAFASQTSLSFDTQQFDPSGMQ